MAKSSSGNAQGKGASYEAYSKAYDKQAAKLAKKGLEMYDSKLTKSEYKTIYALQRESLKADVSEGKRKTIGNVNQYLVRKQAYEISDAKAKALAKAAKATGQKLTKTEIRNDPSKFDWNKINEDLKAGKTQKEISQTYFGSPE